MDFLRKNRRARLNMLMTGLWLFGAALVAPALAADKALGLRIATFQTDATPPIGYDMGYSVVKKSASRCSSKAW